MWFHRKGDYIHSWQMYITTIWRYQCTKYIHRVKTTTLNPEYNLLAFTMELGLGFSMELGLGLGFSMELGFGLGLVWKMQLILFYNLRVIKNGKCNL